MAIPVIPSVLADWQILGGILWRVKGGIWVREDDLQTLQHYDHGDIEVAYYPSFRATFPRRTFPNLSIVRVRAMRPDDVRDANFSNSEESGYLSIDGYRWRVSTHSPVWARSEQGVVAYYDMLPNAVEVMIWSDSAGNYVPRIDWEHAEAWLRQRVKEWISADKRAADQK